MAYSDDVLVFTLDLAERAYFFPLRALTAITTLLIAHKQYGNQWPEFLNRGQGRANFSSRGKTLSHSELAAEMYVASWSDSH